MSDISINVRRAAMEINKILQELEKATGAQVDDVRIRRDSVRRLDEKVPTEFQSVEIVLQAPVPIRKWA